MVKKSNEFIFPDVIISLTLWSFNKINAAMITENNRKIIITT